MRTLAYTTEAKLPAIVEAAWAQLALNIGGNPDELGDRHGSATLYDGALTIDLHEEADGPVWVGEDSAIAALVAGV